MGVVRMDGVVAAGKVGGLFGNNGGVTLVLYDTFPRDVNMEEPLLVEIDGHVVPLFFESFARRGVRGATALFADIDTPRRAEEFLGREFFLRVAGGGRGRGLNGVVGAASDDGSDNGSDDGSGELYFEDLIGWTVDVGGGLEGRITAFFESELNPLIEIEIAGVRELIPAQAEFVTDVDEAAHRITLSLPEGLLGLNG